MGNRLICGERDRERERERKKEREKRGEEGVGGGGLLSSNISSSKWLLDNSLLSLCINLMSISIRIHNQDLSKSLSLSLSVESVLQDSTQLKSSRRG